jgi:4-aminobutyrate aminotransferase-like enzyme
VVRLARSDAATHARTMCPTPPDEEYAAPASPPLPPPPRAPSTPDLPADAGAAAPPAAAADGGAAGAAPCGAAAACDDELSTTAALVAARAACTAANVALHFPKAPLHVVRGAAQFLYDADGGAYLDCVNNVAHVGHCQADVADALCEQLHTLNTNSRYLQRHLVDYAAALRATLPPALRVLFWCNSGSEANDLALRLARQHTRRRGVVCVGGAYHGHVSSMIDASPYKYHRAGGAGQRCVRAAALRRCVAHAPPWHAKPSLRRRVTLRTPLRRFVSTRSHVRQAPVPDAHSGLHRGDVCDEALGAAYAAELAPLLASFKRQASREAARRAHAARHREQLASRRAAAPRDDAAAHAALDEEEEALLLDGDEDDGLSADVGAFFCESILSCAGQVVSPAGYLRRAYAAVRAAGGVCIADEVQVGFGRCGSAMWGFQAVGGPDAIPDIVTMGKPAGNGYPLALVVTTAEIAASFAAGGMEVR